jgi:hypothetical protein
LTATVIDQRLSEFDTGLVQEVVTGSPEAGPCSPSTTGRPARRARRAGSVPSSAQAWLTSRRPGSKPKFPARPQHALSSRSKRQLNYSIQFELGEPGAKQGQ